MPTTDPLAFVRYLDVAIVVLAAPFVIFTGAPVLGYLVGAGAWLATRIAGVAAERAAARRTDARAVAAINLAVLLGRVWIVGLSILAVGLAADREDGLMAALTALVAFTVYLATSLITKPLERNPRA
jgi:hypothetical protein